MSFNKLTTRFKGDVLDLEDLFLSTENRLKINQLLEEITYIEALKKYNLPVVNKILLHGETGCGKTATAHAIAKKLGKKIVSFHLGNFVSSKLGETAKNITTIFNSTRIENAILFIDEFDFIGKAREFDDKDSAEMKRVVNVLLQQIDQLNEDILLICATNHIQAIDTALLRRFQLKLKYDQPTREQLDNYYTHLLSAFPKDIATLERIYNISYAETKDYILQQVKSNVITLEKQKKQYLFSYGTLQLERVQLETYGRKLLGNPDNIRGYKLEELRILDQKVLEISNKVLYPIAIKTSDLKDSIHGKIFEVTTEELYHTDKYKVNQYQRVLETFESGIKAWIYIKK